MAGILDPGWQLDYTNAVILPRTINVDADGLHAQVGMQFP